jgi:hypothetical protein
MEREWEEDATAFVASGPSSPAQVGDDDEYLVLMGSVIRRSDVAPPPPRRLNGRERV